MNREPLKPTQTSAIAKKEEEAISKLKISKNLKGEKRGRWVKKLIIPRANLEGSGIPTKALNWGGTAFNSTVESQGRVLKYGESQS